MLFTLTGNFVFYFITQKIKENKKTFNNECVYYFTFLVNDYIIFWKIINIKQSIPIYTLNQTFVGEG